MLIVDGWVPVGCLTGGLARRFRKNGREQTFDKDAPQYDMSKFVPLEMKAGSLVILHGDLVHQRYVISCFPLRPADCPTAKMMNMFFFEHVDHPSAVSRTSLPNRGMPTASILWKLSTAHGRRTTGKPRLFDERVEISDGLREPCGGLGLRR